MLAVGNVGESLVPYSDSDTFLTRDGGFNWEEVHKDAHIWEYGDQGSILLLANDEGVTDRVTYTLNEGLSWNEYVFGERIRVRSIVTVPMDTSRKFILFGINPDQSDASVAVHIDFSSISNVKCAFYLVFILSLTRWLMASPHAQANLIWRIQRPMTLNYGVQAKNEKRNVFSVNKFVQFRLSPFSVELADAPVVSDHVPSKDTRSNLLHRREISSTSQYRQNLRLHGGRF
jgi:hypothetical protein